MNNPYPNASRRVAAKGRMAGDRVDLIQRAKNHLEAMDDGGDTVNPDDRLIGAASCILSALEGGDSGDGGDASTVSNTRQHHVKFS